MKTLNPILHWWITPKFPDECIKWFFEYHPVGFNNKLRNIYRTWILHPLRRRLAKNYVSLLQKVFGLKVIGITGSSGKTTTKEMLASILGINNNTVYSYANIDPVYNIPTTIFKCTSSTKYLILEMGVEYPNEMDFYLWLANPDISVVTNIFPTHTKYLKNIEGVYSEKSKIVKYLTKNSTAVLNNENLYLRRLKNKINANTSWFGSGSEIYASDIKINSNFKTEFVLNYFNKLKRLEIPIIGEQFVSDALAAITVALILKIDMNKIKLGLAKFNQADHRMNITKLKSGAILIDDSYNNNPESAKKAISTLKAVAGNRKTILIFGDMLELGNDEIKYHKEIGKFILKTGINYVIGIGNLSKYVVKNKKLSFLEWNDAILSIKALLNENSVILIKGSRGVQLDNLVDQLK